MPYGFDDRDADKICFLIEFDRAGTHLSCLPLFLSTFGACPLSHRKKRDRCLSPVTFFKKIVAVAREIFYTFGKKMIRRESL